MKKQVVCGQTRYLISDNAAYEYKGSLKKILTVEGDVQIQDIVSEFALLSKTGFKVDGTQEVDNYLVTISVLNQTYT